MHASHYPLPPHPSNLAATSPAPAAAAAAAAFRATRLLQPRCSPCSAEASANDAFNRTYLLPASCQPSFPLPPLLHLPPLAALRPAPTAPSSAPTCSLPASIPASIPATIPTCLPYLPLRCSQLPLACLCSTEASANGTFTRIYLLADVKRKAVARHGSWEQLTGKKADLRGMLDKFKQVR